MGNLQGRRGPASFAAGKTRSHDEPDSFPPTWGGGGGRQKTSKVIQCRMSQRKKLCLSFDLCPGGDPQLENIENQQIMQKFLHYIPNSLWELKLLPKGSLPLPSAEIHPVAAQPPQGGSPVCDPKKIASSSQHSSQPKFSELDPPRRFIKCAMFNGLSIDTQQSARVSRSFGFSFGLVPPSTGEWRIVAPNLGSQAVATPLPCCLICHLPADPTG